MCNKKIRFKLLLRGGYNVKKLWDEWGRTYYNEGGRKNLEPQHNFLIKNIKEIQPESILEVGCGFGRNLKIIKEGGFNCKLIGMDISKSMLKKAQEYLKDNSAELICADATKIPFGDKCFDITFTYGCLMHVPPGEIKNVLQELIRVTMGYIINIEENFGDKEKPKNGILKINEYTFAYDYAVMYKKLELDLLENKDQGNLNMLLVQVK